LMGIIYEG